jgi:hypothetical protein
MVLTPMLTIIDVTSLGLARPAVIGIIQRLAITILPTSGMRWRITMMLQSQHPSRQPPFPAQ